MLRLLPSAPVSSQDLLVTLPPGPWTDGSVSPPWLGPWGRGRGFAAGPLVGPRRRGAARPGPCQAPWQAAARTRGLRLPSRPLNVQPPAPSLPAAVLGATVESPCGHLTQNAASV